MITLSVQTQLREFYCISIDVDEVTPLILMKAYNSLVAFNNLRNNPGYLAAWELYKTGNFVMKSGEKLSVSLS